MNDYLGKYMLVFVFFTLMIHSAFGQTSVSKASNKQEKSENALNQNNNPTGPNRGLPHDPDSWIIQKSFTCESVGYTISILRKASWETGQSPYKIQLSYHSTIAEHGNKTRRDNLANWYSNSQLFRSQQVAQNAQWGDYCSKDNTWILGTVYHVVYPNPNYMGGPYTTGISHDSNIHLNVNDINDLVAVLNNKRTFSAPACNDSKCAGWKDDNGKVGDRYNGSRDQMKKINKMTSKDIRYINPSPKKGGG